tara:strand:+ start:2888 stop:3172 length:285 start_codon:yes stop_codon:yes gene_type:complete
MILLLSICILQAPAGHCFLIFPLAPDKMRSNKMNFRDKMNHLALYTLFGLACVLSVNMVPDDPACTPPKTEKPADGALKLDALCESEFLKTHVF